MEARFGCQPLPGATVVGRIGHTTSDLFERLLDLAVEGFLPRRRASSYVAIVGRGL